MYLPIFFNDKSIVLICFLNFGFFGRASRIRILVITSKSIQKVYAVSKPISKSESISESVSKYIGNISSCLLSLGISNDIWQGLSCSNNGESWSWNSWWKSFFTMLTFAKKRIKANCADTLDGWEWGETGVKYFTCEN